MSSPRFEGHFSKNTKNNSEKRGKRTFWVQFWANFDHPGQNWGHSSNFLKILKLKVALHCLTNKAFTEILFLLFHPKMLWHSQVYFHYSPGG